MTSEEEANYATFRDCLSVAVIERSGGTPAQIVRKNRSSKHSRSRNARKTGGETSGHHASEGDMPAELGEFVDYLAEEAFPALPTELRELTYQALQEDKTLTERYSMPISSDIVDYVANLLPTTIEDSLVVYGIINPPLSDLSSFLSLVLNAYVSTTATPPPPPSTTRTLACEICERDWITLTYHHLIPRAVHAKVLKRGWHVDHRLNDVAWLCRACHSFVHRMASNEELAKEWFSVDRILEREDVQRWRDWVGRVRWKKR